MSTTNTPKDGTKRSGKEDTPKIGERVKKLSIIRKFLNKNFCSTGFSKSFRSPISKIQNLKSKKRLSVRTIGISFYNPSSPSHPHPHTLAYYNLPRDFFSFIINKHLENGYIIAETSIINYLLR
jgi:hypothetical protein